MALVWILTHAIVFSSYQVKRDLAHAHYSFLSTYNGHKNSLNPHSSTIKSIVT